MKHWSNLPTTSEMQALDAAHHLHPFTDARQLHAKGARVITRAKGVYLWDSDGRQILDGMAGLWNVNIGHGRREIVEAVARQMTDLAYYNTFFQTTHPPAIALASKLSALTPANINKAFFVGSGSEANDTVVRLVRHYWSVLGKPDKQVIISRKNAYHGSTMAGASLGGMTPMHAQGGLPIPGITHIDQPYWYGEGGDRDPEDFGLERARALEAEIDRLGESNIAAFIAEPVQGAGGVIIPPASYWPEIMRICAEREILFIADEVICGFGRLGRWFGTDYYALSPDVMSIAKGLSSGYLPIGAVLVGDKVAATLEAKGGEFAHGYTYSGHPACCAAAVENLRIMEEEKIVDRVANDSAPYLRERWLKLGDHPLVGEARALGLMGAIELTPDKANRAAFKEPGKAGAVCRDLCFKNGLVMRSVVDRMVISPPLVINKSEIDELVDKAARTLDETDGMLRSDGVL